MICDNCGDTIDTFRDDYYEGCDDWFGHFVLCENCEGLSIFYSIGQNYKKPLIDEDDDERQ